MTSATSESAPPIDKARIDAITVADAESLSVQFDDNLRKLQEFLDTVQEKSRAFEERFRQAIAYLSWWEAGRRRLEEFLASVISVKDQAVEGIKAAIDDVLLPRTLRHDIKLWYGPPESVYGVAQSISQSTEDVDFPNMRFGRTAADSHWNSRFADAYKSEIPHQHAAVGELMVVAKDMANALTKVYAAETAYYAAWGGVAVQVVGLLMAGWWGVATGFLERVTFARLGLQVVAMQTLARAVSADQGQVMTTIAGSRPLLTDKDVAWPNPFRVAGFARARALADGSVVLEGGAAEMNR